MKLKKGKTNLYFILRPEVRAGDGDQSRGGGKYFGMGSKAIFNSFLSMQRHRANVKFRQSWGVKLPPSRFRRQWIKASRLSRSAG